jgi:hypothetical protein
MSFQSYLDNIELKTGKTPREFIALAEAKGFTDPGVKAAPILQWLKDDFGLGRSNSTESPRADDSGARVRSNAT